MAAHVRLGRVRIAVEHAVEGLAGLGEDGWPAEVTVRVQRDGGSRSFAVRLRIDTATEATYLRHGGVLPFVARTLVEPALRADGGR